MNIETALPVNNHRSDTCFDLSQLTPLQGKLNENKAILRELADSRHHINISVEQWQELKELPYDFYLTKDRSVVIFGCVDGRTVDGGLALMPLLDEDAKVIMDNQFNFMENLKLTIKT